MLLFILLDCCSCVCVDFVLYAVTVFYSFTVSSSCLLIVECLYVNYLLLIDTQSHFLMDTYLMQYTYVQYLCIYLFFHLKITLLSGFGLLFWL